jgi:hypothetical protein
MKPSKPIPGIPNILCLLLFTSLILHVSAQCDDRIEPADDPKTSYKQRDNRCEGSYRTDVSSPTIELVGLLKGKFRYNKDEAEVLQVFSTLNDRTIYVRAQGIPLGTYYQMDARIAASETLRWPIGDVIVPMNLHYRRVSIFGWTGTEKEKTYIPVRVEPEINTITNDDKIRLFIRTGADVSQVNWRVSPVVNGLCSEYGEIQIIEEEFSAGEPILIDLTRLTGEMCVEIKVREMDSGDFEPDNLRILINE